MSQTEPEPELPRTPTIDARGAPAERATAAAIAVAPGFDATVVPSALRDRGWFGLPRTYWVLWGGMLINRLGGSVFFLLSIYLTRERHLSTELAGLVMCLYAAGGVFAGPLGGVLADHFGRRPTLLLGTACAGTLMLALGFARSNAAIVALAPFLGFFTDICRPPLQAAVADVVAPDRRARAFGLLYWALNLGFGGASALGGMLAEHSFGAAVRDRCAHDLCLRRDRARWRAGDAARGASPARPNVQQRTLASASTAWLEPFRDRRFRRFFAIHAADVDCVRAGDCRAAARHARARARHAPARLPARPQRPLHRDRAADRVALLRPLQPAALAGLRRGVVRPRARRQRPGRAARPDVRRGDGAVDAG